ncbi:porin family protein [Anaerophaga thermohalophila]|uniref:porin family protein n=1 Tax=Anaerophaga thermohalophila TaxID=177400 RepID=UPI000237C6B9|nr:porin family protein [Anaerophaga thermohalophila]
MKKLFFIAAVMLLCVSTASFAQAKFGVKAGLNIASLSGDDAEDLDSRLAPFFGGFVNISFSDKLSFQPELLYSMKGAKYSDSGSESIGGITYNYEEESKVKLNYLDIPLMLKINLGSGFNLQAGPQIGLLLSAEEEFEYTASGGDMNESESETTDIKDDLKGMNFGLNVGAGYDFGSLGVDIRYSLGLSNIADYDDGDLKSNAFQIGVSYAF